MFFLIGNRRDDWFSISSAREFENCHNDERQFVINCRICPFDTQQKESWSYVKLSTTTSWVDLLNCGEVVSKKENQRDLRMQAGLLFFNYLFLLNFFSVQNLNKVLKLQIIHMDCCCIPPLIHRQSTCPVHYFSVDSMSNPLRWANGGEGYLCRFRSLKKMIFPV